MSFSKFLFPLLIIGLGLNSLQGQRDPITWPFAQNSIWNMPIGSDAVFVPALIEPVSGWGMTVDEDILFLNSSAPMTAIYTNYAGWDSEKDRCLEEGPLLFTAPIPDDFIVSPDNWDGITPNSGTAFLMPDGMTIKQTQPFARCSADQATSRFTPGDVNIFGAGIIGAHGGSGLSAIGGTLRLGELDEPDDTIRHVLKINLYAAENLYYDEDTKGFRWPAIRADGYAANVYGQNRTSPVVTACRMGALLALPDFIDIDELDLETTPALILARAFQNYGAYIVDDTAWDVYAIITEWSPNGRFTDEFEEAWGFPFKEVSKNTPWTRDMKRIFDNLHVVDNNSETSIGGGGEPLMPLAPPFIGTDVEVEEEDLFRLFPNPCQEIIQINANQSLQISIFQLDGKLIHSQGLVPNSRMNIGHLNPGLYFVELIDETGKRYQRRIIKQ